MRSESLAVERVPITRQQTLPIDAHLSAIGQHLRLTPSVVIQAPPGTGKTTRVAPFLAFDQPQAEELGTILVQPRRIAARASASRIAAERSTSVGKDVGYQVRFDRRVGPSTRLVCMTPGILLRRLQSDAVLADISTVILDEFHERSVELDLLLGLLKQLQHQLRDDLRIVVMSATLASDQIAEYLGNAPVVDVDAKAFHVSIRHHAISSAARRAPVGSTRLIVQEMARLVHMAATKHEGDLLAFLPGVGEIKQLESALATVASKSNWDLLPLYGDMKPEQQDRVLQASRFRKIILATNIAETSLTIDGVRIVVDSGLARVQRMDPATGLDRLMLEPISQASATQRAGRAGRTATGICYRLWDEATGRSRPEQLDPEVLRVDLSAAALQLVGWGEDLAQFDWLTAPKETATAMAMESLTVIGAITRDGLTDIGRVLLRMPLAPRLGKLVIEGHRAGILRQATVAAALLSERDIFDRQAASRPTQPNGAGELGCDLAKRAQIVLGAGGNQPDGVHRGAVSQVQRVADQLFDIAKGELGDSVQQPLGDRLGRCLLNAFPDRLARRRGAGSPRGVMVGGRGVKLAPSSTVGRAELFLCLSADAKGADATVRLASRVERDWLTSEQLQEDVERFFNPTTGSVVSRRRVRWFDLLLEEKPVETPLDEATTKLLAKATAPTWRKLLPQKDRELASWINRVAWLAQAMPDAGFPTFSETEIVSWIENWGFGLRSTDDLKQLPWASLLPSVLDQQQLKALQREAPERIHLPAGREVLLKYAPGTAPVLEVKIQECFGWIQTPTVAGGRVRLLLHLLAPNGRCQQITDDLASFWTNTYPAVRKQLRGRYPKHAWPEDPLAQPPQSGSLKRQ